MNLRKPITFRWILVSLAVSFIASCSTSATDLPTSEEPTEMIPTPTVVEEAAPEVTSTPEPQLCKEGNFEDHPYYTIVDPDTIVEMVWEVQFIPWWLRATHDGRLLAITRDGDSIYELKPDGSLEVVFRCPGIKIESFAIATDESIWFGSREEERLYRLNSDGSLEIMKKAFGRLNLEAGPDGSVYAMNHGLTRFDRDGKSEELTNMISSRQFAIGPEHRESPNRTRFQAQDGHFSSFVRDTTFRNKRSQP